MKILVLGAGGMGQVTARDLVESPEVSQVILGDIDSEKLEEFAGKVKSKKLSVEQIDVTDHNALVKLMKGIDAVGHGTVIPNNMGVYRAAMEARVNMADLGGASMVPETYSIKDEVKDAGIRVVPGIGISVGVTNVLVRHAVNRLDEAEEVHIHAGIILAEEVAPGELMKIPYDFGGLLKEFTWNSFYFRDGEIKEIPPLSGKGTYKFPEPLGELEGHYTLHSEMRTIPFPELSNIKGIKQVDVKLYTSPELQAALRTLIKIGLAGAEPIKVKGITITPREFLEACFQGRVATKDIISIVVKVLGKKDGKAVQRTYEMTFRPYERWGVGATAWATGIPLSIAVQMLARGDIKEKGMLSPERAFDPPEPFIAELTKRGFEIRALTRTHELL